MGKGKNSDPLLLQAQQVRNYIFGVINGEREKWVLTAVYYLSRYLRPKNNDQCRSKKKRPARTASTAGTCLSVVRIGDAPALKVPRHLHHVNCFKDGMLEFGVPVGQCFSRFPTVSQRSRRRGKRKKGTG